MRTTARNISTAMVATLLATAASCAGPKVNDALVERASVTDGRELLTSTDKALFIDTRPDAAYRAGHLPGAVNIRLQDLNDERFRAALAGRSPLVIYGQNPGSATSMAFAKRLMALGYKKVMLLEQGVDGWTAQGGRVVSK